MNHRGDRQCDRARSPCLCQLHICVPSLKPLTLPAEPSPAT